MPKKVKGSKELDRAYDILLKGTEFEKGTEDVKSGIDFKQVAADSAVPQEDTGLCFCCEVKDYKTYKASTKPFTAVLKRKIACYVTFEGKTYFKDRGGYVSDLGGYAVNVFPAYVPQIRRKKR